NTCAAFDNGLALGADGLELDVHLSRDGIVVVHHDPTLDRTTNLTGAIVERTADELARADAGCRFRRGDAAPFAGQGVVVPTLAVSPPFVDMAHRAGLGVQVWTVDADADARRLLGWGVDGLITDRPDRIVPVVRSGIIRPCRSS